MEIKSNLGRICLLCLAPSIWAQYDFEVVSTVGYRSRSGDLAAYPGGMGASSLAFYHYTYQKLNADLGLDQAAYIDLDMKLSFVPAENVMLEAYLNGNIVQEYAQVGLRALLVPSLRSQYVTVSSGLDASLGFSNSASIDAGKVDLMGELSFQAYPNVTAFLSGHYPIYGYSEVGMKIEDSMRIAFDAKPSIKAGLRFTLWPFEMAQEPVAIIVQEPIAIPVAHIESEVEPVIFDFEEDEILIDSVEMVEESVPDGWFAQLIEFISRLFKF